MSIEAYLLRGYEHPHEDEMFAVVLNALRARFEKSPDRHVLIGNVTLDGNDLDALFIKPKGACVLEMKACGGQVVFRENTPWLVGSQEVVGGSRPNPFLQVRAYRYGLKQVLKARAPEILDPNRDIYWDHISALVVFRYSVQFDDRLLAGLRSWFGITDVDHLGDRLDTVGSPNWDLSVAEIGHILKVLGIDERYRYSQSGPSDSPAVLPAPQTASPGFLRLYYLKDLAFRDHESRMRLRGGARSQGAQRVRELFEQVRQGLNPFESLEKASDARVKGSAVYSINSVTQLLMIQSGGMMFPAFLGEPTETQSWLTAHAGLLVAVDSESGRIQVTRLAEPGCAAGLQPPALSTVDRPLFQQLQALSLEDLVSSRKLREALLELDDTSTDADINDTLEMIADPDVRGFLFDLINLLRAGDRAAAETRLRLRVGASLPIEDIGPFGDAAAESPANSDQILLINALSQHDLDRLLDPKHFQDWMLFLHPDQKLLAEAEFARPVVLTGVSGSGKTCILVHRARSLARRYPGQRIGIVTLSRSLAGLLHNLVNALLTEEEKKHVAVETFYDLFRRCLEQLGPDKYFSQLASMVSAESHLHTVLAQAKRNWPRGMVWNCDPIAKDTVEEQWEYFFMSQNQDVREWMDGLVKYLEEYRVDASRYLEEEFMLIRSQFAVPNRENYLATDEKSIRAGRAIPMKKELRQDALRLLLFWEEWLLAGGMIDDLGLTQALMPLHAQMAALPEAFRFRCLLVDEFQDFSTLDLQLFRRVVPVQQPDALFLAGDTVQKILVKRQSLRDSHLDRGPATHKTISKNYRNSKQVLQAAGRLPNHYASLAQAQGEEIEVLNPELALRETNPPIVLKTTDEVAKAWEIVVECTQDNKAEPWTICIATVAPREISTKEILDRRPNGIPARALSGDCMLHPEEVVVGTINDLKGFEFKLVLILGCNLNAFPEQGVPEGEVWRDALRLYVAMTRGRDQVYLLHSREPSEFLAVMGDYVIRREEPLLQKCAVGVVEANDTQAQISEGGSDDGRSLLNWDDSCEDWFTVAELDILHRYFAKHVYRDGLTFREWLKPKSLDLVLTGKLLALPKSSGPDLASLVHKLRNKGLRIASVPDGWAATPQADQVLRSAPPSTVAEMPPREPGMHKCATEGCSVQISVRKKYCKRCRTGGKARGQGWKSSPQSPARCRGCGGMPIPGSDYCYNCS